MLGWIKGKPAPERESLLGAVVVRNELVREKRAGGEAAKAEGIVLGATVLRLTAPVVHAGLRGIFGGKKDKSFDLDELGAFVWDAVDGRRTVEGMIRYFAAEQRVNVREAEVAVLAFLKILAKRNLVGMVARGEVQSKRRAPRRRRKN